MNEWITYAYLPAFARAFAVLVRQGMPLREALQALRWLQGDADAGEWQSALASLGEAVEEGALLSAAMRQRPDVFPELLIALVRAGEVSSTLDACLERYAEYARAEHALCGGRTPERLEPALETALWCRRMHLLLTSGVPILQSMEVSVQPPASDLLREAVLIARAGVREGQPLKASLKEFPDFFPPFVCQFLLLGEETGTLDLALLWAADFLERSRQLPPPRAAPREMPGPVAPTSPDALGEVFLAASILTPEAWDDAYRRWEEKPDRPDIVHFLVKEGLLKEKDVAKAQAQLLGITFVDLEQFKINPDAVPYIEEEVARRYGLLAVQRLERRLFVAMADPSNVLAVDELKRRTGLEIVTALATLGDVERAIERYYGEAGGEDARGVPAKVSPPPPARAAGEEEVPPHARADVSDTSTETPPVIRVANAIIAQALKERASDIHLELGSRFVRVRYRIDGVLHERMQLPDYIHGPLVARLKLMAGLSAAERGAPQRGQIGITWGGQNQNLRVQTYPFSEGDGVTLHIVSRPEPFSDLASLGMLPEQVALCERLLRQPCGVLAIAGPHGSGRTTTLHTLLRLLRRGEASLAALEDPIEDVLEGVKQIAVGPARGLSFAEGIRGLMHQDPDVIGVGDVRDAETAVEVAHAAAGGHLLLVGIAATDAVHALERLVRLDPEGMPGQVVGVIGQRLLRTLCPQCRGEATCAPEDAGGCHATGYQGRTGIFEILEVGSVEMRKQAHAGAFRMAVRELATQEGMVTLAQAAERKVQDGVTDEAEVRRALG